VLAHPCLQHLVRLPIRGQVLRLRPAAPGDVKADDAATGLAASAYSPKRWRNSRIPTFAVSVRWPRVCNGESQCCSISERRQSDRSPRPPAQKSRSSPRERDRSSAGAIALPRSMRQTHRAGEKLCIDYSGDTVPVINAVTGEILRAQIFVASMGASKYPWI